MSAHDLVFYDGGCGLCHRAVKFFVRRDSDGSRFRFAPLGGTTFAAEIDEEVARDLPDSIVVVTAAGDVIVRSRAALHLFRRLGFGWRVIGGILSIFPRVLLDAGYDFIASIRFSLFKRPSEACPILPPELRNRFLP